MRRIYIFKGFERFWHWAQALLMITMLATGFEIHGSWSLVGFKQAVALHESAAWALMVLWVFAIFWHFVTGEWRQYIPSTEKMADMAKYYVLGIFRGDEYPHHPTTERKHNPLQRVTYLGLKVFLHPLIWITGLALLFYPYWDKIGLSVNHEMVVTLHVFGAFLILAFLIAHLYLITTGEKIGSHMKAMLTGYEEVDD